MQMRTVPFFFAAEGGKGAAWQRNAYLLDEMLPGQPMKMFLAV